MTAWALSVAVWAVCGAVGLTLALAGLKESRGDRAVVLASGRNGLLDHLARAAVRAWTARAAVQVVMVVFAMLCASIPAPMLPADAGAAAVLRLLAIRWALSVVSVLLVGVSVMDLRDRRRAGEIASGQKGAGHGPTTGRT